MWAAMPRRLKPAVLLVPDGAGPVANRRGRPETDFSEEWLPREMRSESDDREFARMWRTLARLITLFDEASPASISCERNRRVS